MGQIAGWFTGIVLTLTAGLHIYWGLGGLWPAQSEPELVRTVIGVQSDHMPATGVTLIVAALIFAAAGFGFARGVLGRDSALFIRVPLAVLTLIFLGRGILPYITNGPMSGSVEPFQTLNLMYFSPLTLAIGLCFGVLLLRR